MSAQRKPPYRLPAALREELVNMLRLRPLLTNKRLCQRYGVSLSTLKRIQQEAFDRPMSQIGPQDVRDRVLNDPQAQKPTRAA